MKPELHPEQGTVWEWIYENDEEIYGQFSAAYNRPGAGALRKLDDRSMEELHRIFDVTGGKEFFDTIESIPTARPARWDTTVRTTST